MGNHNRKRERDVRNEAIERYVERAFPSQYGLVISGGKLIGDWGNVARHCFVQTVAAEEMADLLGLSHQEKLLLASVAACHDWEKRLQRKSTDFTDEEKKDAQVLFQAAHPDAMLMGALTPYFLLKVLAGEASFLQLIQFLIDDMAKGDEFVSFDERIDEVSARNPNPEPEVQEELGRPYWDVEREIGHGVEKMVYAILNARHIPCASIAVAINERLKNRF